MSAQRLRPRLIGQEVDWQKYISQVDKLEFAGVLDHAVELLRILAGRDQEELHFRAAHITAAALGRIRDDWESGRSVTIDKAIGWQRPQKWQRDKALRNNWLKFRAYEFMEAELKRGVSTYRGVAFANAAAKLNAWSKKMGGATIGLSIDQLNVGPGTVKSLYYAARQELGLVKPKS